MGRDVKKSTQVDFFVCKANDTAKLCDITALFLFKKALFY